MAIIQGYPEKPLTSIMEARCLWSMTNILTLRIFYESVVPYKAIMQGYPGKLLVSILEAKGYGA